MSSMSMAVPMIETTIDPKQPSRLEKNANMVGLKTRAYDYWQCLCRTTWFRRRWHSNCKSLLQKLSDRFELSPSGHDRRNPHASWRQVQVHRQAKAAGRAHRRRL